ncbi:MAG: hypothetical protein MUF36_10130 [Bacteroidales bacterium]|jgi:hypothetical protein|nr:hypothetical protein [Bacteroidales bacterium]
MKNKGEILASILKEFKECYFFLHNTKEFSVVEKIMNEGFIFENQLPHSSDRVNPNEPIEVTYFLFQRKDYGTFTMILAFPRDIYEKYSAISNSLDTGIEEVMTITDPYFGDNDELMYTVSPKHVLGYFNIKTSEFFRNVNWDPGYDNTLYRKPVKRPVKPDRQE